MADHGPAHYKKIYYILLALLIVSIIGPEIGIQVVTLITAFGIAVVKAYLVAKHFMHVNIEPRFLHYALVVTLGFMLVFYFGVAPDVMNHEGRNWKNVAAETEVERATKQYKEEAKHGAHHGSDHGKDHGKASPAH